jgi:small subunit ribosomal protein S8
MDILSTTFSTLQNAQRKGHLYVRLRFSSHVWAILLVLYTEGYIAGCTRHQGSIVTKLKYVDGRPGMTALRRVSKPGKQQYTSAHALPMVRHGLGSYILSTSHGVLCDRDALRLRVGGELLAYVV